MLKHFVTTLTAILALASALPAAEGIKKISVSDASRYAASEEYETGVAGWIWADKYTYSPGQSATVRWSFRTYGETYPFTAVAYWQNNQTGDKTYLPRLSSTPTDIFGNTVQDGFQPFLVTDTDKGVLIGEGGLFPASAGAIPDQPGMTSMVVELRNAAGDRILKTMYFKLGIVTETVTVNSEISSDTTWVNTKQYNVAGVVYVNNGATLTIEPGTFVIGQPGSQPPSVIVVTRNGKIKAEGTQSRPIVMTSSLPFGQRTRGDWGGLIMLGRALVNVGGNTNGSGNTAGEFYIEGLPASENTKYGGDQNDWDCGSLKYVRVEYAGSIFAPNNEANSFTWGGCGTKTKAEFVQAIYGLDDSFEWFGGSMNAKYLVGGLGADDYIDFQLGYTGQIQFGVFYQSPESRSNRGIEGDNSEFNNAATPWSNPTIYNTTYIGSTQPGFDEPQAPGVYLRRGARVTLNNTIVTAFASKGLFIDGATTQAQIANGEIKMNGFILWDNGLTTGAPNTLPGQVEGVPTLDFAEGKVGNGRNFVVADPRLRRPFEYNDPDFRPLPVSPALKATFVQPPDNGFFTQDARFCGGAGATAWWSEWTNFLTEAAVRQ